MIKRRRSFTLGSMIVLFIAVALIALFVISIRAARNNIFRQTDCSLPCWYEIRPGESTEEEFLESVEQYPRNFASLSRYENTETISYRWLDKNLRLHISAFIKNDRVQVIRINASNQINLGQLFATLGEPSMYKAEIAGGDEGSFFAFFFDEEIGIAYSKFDYPYDSDALRGDDECSINFSEEFTVEKIYIYKNDDPDLGSEIVTGRQGAVPWEGFEEARLAGY